MDVNWSGVIDGHDAVQVRQRWLASTKVDPARTADHGYRITVIGDPSVKVNVEIWPTDEDLANLTTETMHSIGMRITATPVVNAIPSVCNAPPSVATCADLSAVGSPITV